VSPVASRDLRQILAPEQNTAIASGVDLFRKVFLSSHDAILLLSSTAGQFLDLNPQASVIFGYSRHQFLQLPPRRTICLDKGQWELLLDSVSCKREKWLRGMACRQRSGRIILRDIFPSLVNVNGTPCILATLHGASYRELSETLRSNARFTRFSNAVAVGAAQAPNIEQAIRFCLHQICDFAHCVFAHAHIFSSRIVAAHVPVDIWHFGLDERAESLKATFVSKRFVFPSGWYSRVLVTARTFVEEDLDAELDFAGRLEGAALSLKSALVVPILVGRELVGACQYFSDQPINRDQIFLDTMSHLAGRLGHIIEQKRLDEAVRNLSTKLVQAQDDERRRLARALHDTTAQNVAAILMDLRVIENVDPALPSKAQHALSECISLARRSLTELRTLSYLLHPPMLDELGLVSALGIFVEGFSQRSGMHVRLDLPKACPKFPKELEITLFRVVQEGLTNARRHSDGTAADVSLRFEPNELRLRVENETTSELLPNQPPVNPAKLGVGMRSMRERVEQLGGHLTLDIGKNRTVLQASFPVAQNAHAAST
jgi:signal transduction histidine kinase